jgi:hypothetical protein
VKGESTPINANATRGGGPARFSIPDDVLFGDVAVVIGDPELLAARSSEQEPAERRRTLRKAIRQTVNGVPQVNDTTINAVPAHPQTYGQPRM